MRSIQEMILFLIGSCLSSNFLICRVPRNFINSRAFEHIFLFDNLVESFFFLLDFFFLEFDKEEIELDDEDEGDEDDDEDDEESEYESEDESEELDELDEKEKLPRDSAFIST